MPVDARRSPYAGRKGGACEPMGVLWFGYPEPGPILLTLFPLDR
jgi:hypothetical protein